MKANLFRDELMEETLCVAENQTNRFNVEAFPPDCLPRFLVSVVAWLHLNSCNFLNIFWTKRLFNNFLIFFLIRPHSDHWMYSWKGWKDLIPVMNALFFWYCFDFPSSERSGLFSFHLASFSEQVIHISNTLQSLALIRGIEENNRISAHYSDLTAPITGQAWTKGSNALGKEAFPYGCVLGQVDFTVLFDKWSRAIMFLYTSTKGKI